MSLSDRLTSAGARSGARSGVRRGIGIAVAVVVVLAWWWWPLTRSHSAVDVVVVGNGAVDEARDELARRLRQEGMVPAVVVIDPDECGDLAAVIDESGESGESEESEDALVVLSLDDWSWCRDVGGIDLVVQQPIGPMPAGVDATLGMRASAPLFGSDAQPCQWWDTPGAGEARPGLGQCAADGRVEVLDGGALTPAGRERFARLVVEALK